MVSAISDVVLPQGSTGQSRQSANAGTQDFSTVLSGKVSGRQQVTPSQAASHVAHNAAAAADSQADNQTNSQAAGDADTQSATPDLLAEKIDAKLNAGGQDAAADVTPVPAAPITDTAVTPVTVPANPQPDADPALDSSAAATLAALLAQTQPAATQTSADSAANANSLAVQTANANGVSPTDLAAQDTASDAGSATVSNAGATSAATAAATSATSQAAADAAKTAVPVAEVLSSEKTAQTDANTSLKVKLPAAIENAAAKAKATVTAMPAKSALPHGDAAQTTAQTIAQLTPTVANQDSGDTPLTTTTSNDATLLLKKTGDVSVDSGSTALSAAAPTLTSTLNAADTTGAATPIPSSALISAQLGSDEWQQAIGQQVLMQVRNGQQNAELRLHPESLGALQISLQIDGANQAQIHLASGHSQVRSALEDALPQLRAALADSGINLGQSSVGADATPNWTGSGQDNGGGRSAQAFSVDSVAASADETPSSAPAAASGRAAGIDTFA